MPPLAPWIRYCFLNCSAESETDFLHRNLWLRVKDVNKPEFKMDQVDKCLIVEQLVEVSRISDAEDM